jgi:outer membrane biogenesis lipoprotein LolB
MHLLGMTTASPDGPDRAAAFTWQQHEPFLLVHLEDCQDFLARGLAAVHSAQHHGYHSRAWSHVATWCTTGMQ